MTTSDEHTHVFIVRIWREPREIARAPAEWRGSVEHLASGEREYVRHVEQIGRFIAHYWSETAPASAGGGRVGRWLTRWKKA
jgi:hypothetical protein